MDIETTWSAELEKEVTIREFQDWGEFDIYIDGSFMVTVGTLAQADHWLARYSMLQDQIS